MGRYTALQFEPLTDRVVPSCTWIEAGGVLTITGDSQANVIEIVDDGTTLTITCDGEDVVPNGEITDLVLKLGSGNDSVTYTFTGSLAAGAVRTLDVSLGNGMDTFAAAIEDGSTLGDGSTLDIVARGMNGHDSLSFTATGIEVGTGATLSAVLAGGNGKDTIDYSFGGVLLGDLFLSAPGGNGKDEISGTATLDAGSTGTAEIEILGGNGKDALSLWVTDNSGDDGDPSTEDASTLTSLTATADGGRGPDLADVSDGVDVIDSKKK